LWKLTSPDCLFEAAKKVAGVDRPELMLNVAVGVAALTVAPVLGGALGFAVAAGLTAEGALRDMLLPDPGARARRAGRRLAGFSPDGLVVVLVDDAEWIPVDILEVFLTGLLDRLGGRVLAVVVADPSSELVGRLRRLPSPGLLADGLRWIDVSNSAMSINDRRELIVGEAGGWPAVAIDRLAARTRTFKDIYKVLAEPQSEDVAADPNPGSAIDRLVSLALPMGEPTAAEVVVAWCGGLMHDEELTVALAAGGFGREERGLIRLGEVMRLKEPGRRAELCERAKGRRTRSEMADAIVAVAAGMIADGPRDAVADAGLLRPVVTLVDNEDLQLSSTVLQLVAEFVNLLSQTGDLRVARDLAIRFTNKAIQMGQTGSQFDRLAAAALALSVVTLPVDTSLGLASEMVDPDNAAVFGIEARLWAIIRLLQDEHTRSLGITRAGQLLPDLDANILGAAANEWRLQLAAAASRAQAFEVAMDALAPLLALPENSELRHQAEQVVFAQRSAHFDDVLGVAVLEQELQDTPLDAPEDRLRLHQALADLYSRLGDWRNARDHGTEALTLLTNLGGADHPEILRIRNSVASWTGHAGDVASALARFEALLPDQVGVQGADHPDTLRVRNNIALWTAQLPDVRAALALFEALLRDQTRALGRDHPDTLTTRLNIAALTGQAGDVRAALALFEALVPDQARVLEPDDREILATRVNIAAFTGQSGDGRAALAQLEALLPDQVRVLGPDHPSTLRTRDNIAFWREQQGRDS
jgi:hypothetical protein